MAWLNLRRLRDYPRLVGVAMFAVLLAELVLRQGWLGGLGQIIGSDFVTLYAAGQLWSGDLGRLYDFTAQAAAQQALIAPTQLPGLNPFISPPYVALAYSAFTVLPLPWVLALWTLITFGCLIGAVLLLYRVCVSPTLVRDGLTPVQLMVVIASSFAFVSGVRVGQESCDDVLACCRDDLGNVT